MKLLTRREVLATTAAAGVLQGAPAAPTVDSHVHVWKKDPSFPWARETKSPPAKDATAETLIELMKASGVQKTVIIQVIYYRWDNSYLASVLKTYPQYFRGVARVNPEDPAAPDHLALLTDNRKGSNDLRQGPLRRRCAGTPLAPATQRPDRASSASWLPFWPGRH